MLQDRPRRTGEGPRTKDLSRTSKQPSATRNDVAEDLRSIAVPRGIGPSWPHLRPLGPGTDWYTVANFTSILRLRAHAR